MFYSAHRASVAALVRRMESGNVDGIFADLQFIPMLFALVVVGLFFALIGFYRVGASFATQEGALVGAASPGTGQQMLTSSWIDWTLGNGPSDGFVVISADRAVQTNLSTSGTFDYLGLGPWTMQILGQTYTRSERFYPGGPVCNGNNCSE
jgi:hypothetical protein